MILSMQEEEVAVVVAVEVGAAAAVVALVIGVLGLVAPDQLQELTIPEQEVQMLLFLEELITHTITNMEQWKLIKVETTVVDLEFVF